MGFLLPAIILAFALAMDAFAVALAQGAAFRLTWRDLLKIALLFGLLQGLMPWLGWLIGAFAIAYVEAVDHWIAFVLLGFLGVRMIFFEEEEAGSRPLAGWPLLVAGFAESVDAFAAGLTLPTMDLPVLATCAIIALVTAIIAAIGVKLGSLAGERFGRPAEIVGGVMLIGIGTLILFEHLGVV